MLLYIYFRSAQPSPVACDYVSTIQGSPGLYFDKLLDVKFTNNEWNVITYIDIGHIKPNLDKIEFLFEKVNLFCNTFPSSKIQNDCINSLSALKNQHLNNINKFSSISYLLADEKSNRRSKRGLMDFGGSLLKTFFGTLDAEDALKFSKAINDVQSDEKQLSHLMKDNIHVIKSTISSFNNSISKVNENEKHLMENMKIIQDVMEKISNSNDKIEIKSQLNSLLTSLESIIITLSFDIDDINNAILFAKLNILHPTVLNPHQLYSELDRHRNNLPKHYELPVSLTLQNMHELIDISKLVCFYHFNKIIIVVKIPLVLLQVYNLYNVVPLPVPYDISKPDTFVLIAPTNAYVAITVDHMFYSLITDLDKCKVISEKCYVCVLVNVFSTIANPICETVILSDAISKIPDSCSTRLIHGSIDVFHKISGNRWIFVQSEPGKCHITCDNKSDSLDVILFGTGTLNLPKNCKAFYKTLQFTPASDTISLNISNKISDFNIIMDDCCDKTKLNKTFVKLPYNKLDNNHNLDSLVHASIQLDSFEKELEKLENPSHFETYGIHYMSFSYIVTVVLFIYLLYKSRNWVCKKNPSNCCIQIFNQCNNKKVKDRSSMEMVVVKDPKEDLSDSSSEEAGDVRVAPSPIKRNIIITKTHDN